MIMKNTNDRYLRSPELEAVSALEYTLPSSAPISGIYVVDTADLFAALEGDSGSQKRSLERICRHLQIRTEFLHNAGNDAHVSVGGLEGF